MVGVRRDCALLKVVLSIVVAGKGCVKVVSMMVLYITQASALDRVHLLYTCLKVKHHLISILPSSFGYHLYINFKVPDPFHAFGVTKWFNCLDCEIPWGVGAETGVA